MSMRRFPPTSLIILALIISAAGQVPAAHAADTCTNAGTPCTAADGSAGSCAADPETNGYYCLPSAYGTATASNPGGSIDPAPAKSNTDLTKSTDSAYSYVMQKIMTLFAWLVGVAAITLDNAVYYTVVTMGEYIKNLSAVGVTWRILRDIGNIMLIFGFLAVGITTILNVDWYGVSKKMLPMMFVAAVFLNFSLFISEAIVDTGNLFATQFYTQINGGKPAGLKDLTFTDISNEGISQKIMSQLGLQSIYGAALTNKELFQAGNSWLIGFMGIILFLVVAFVMFSLAFILIARFIALIFLIIVAPIGFAGLAIPGFAARAGQYWKALFEQTITAPILLLMLYIALAVITDVQFMTGFGSSTNPTGWTGFIQNGTNMSNLPGFASLVLSFLVAMGLLLAVVVYAKRWSAFGGDWATRTAGKLTFGLAGAGMRTTAGFGSQFLSRKLASSKLGRVPIVGRSLGKALNYGAKASFDVRGTGVLKTIPFGSQIDAGEAQKGGYRAREEAAIKGREDYAKTLTGREQTRKEKDAIAAAEKATQDAKQEHTNANQELNAAKGEKTRQNTEVERLEKEDERNKKFSINDAATQETERKLNDARRKLAESTTAESVAFDKERNATDAQTNAINKEKKTKETVLARTGSSAEAQKAYAGNIQWGPGRILFRNRKAAENIVRNAGKSPEMRQVEALMDQIKKASTSTTGSAPAAIPSPAGGAAAP